MERLQLVQGRVHERHPGQHDLPVYIDRAVDLACHEGYPGHHVYNVLLDKHLVRDRGWVEFSVYPLFSPQSLIAEGTANFGIDVAFPGRERRRSSGIACIHLRDSTSRKRRHTTKRRSSRSGCPMRATRRRA